MPNRKPRYCVIPPETNAEFAAQMKAVLEVYAQPYDPSRSVSCMHGQAVPRFGDLETLKVETAAWPCAVNHLQRSVAWQMKVGDARYELASVYPKIES